MTKVKTENPKAKTPMSPEKKAEKARKAKAKRDALKAKKEAEQSVIMDESKGGKKEFWARQIRLNGRTITGEVKPDDKEEWLKDVRKRGGKVILSNWIIDNDWRERVLKAKKKDK